MRVAVVTGGSSGIGAALARRLKSRGWQCVLVARGAERLVRVADELGAEHEVCDVGDREAVERMAAAVIARHPKIGLLVNNAGIPGRTGFLDADPDRIEDVTRVNYLGGVWCLRAFLPALEAARPAHVVNVVSVAGAVSGAGTSGLYTASKHAQLAFSRSVATELEPRGIRVHTVLPGFAETEGFPAARRPPAARPPFRDRGGRRRGGDLERGRAQPPRGARASLLPAGDAGPGRGARPRRAYRPLAEQAG